MREIKLRDGEVGLFFRRCMRLCSISKMSTVCSADLIAATERSKHIFRQRVIQTVRELFEME